LILVAIILSVLVAYSYWRDTRETIDRRKRVILSALRISLLLCLLILLLRPVLAFTMEASIRRSLPILVDASGSMKIQDPRLDEKDLKRAAIAMGKLDPRGGLDQPLAPANSSALKLVPRIDLLRGVLRNERLNLKRKLEEQLDLEVFPFGDDLQEEVAAANSASAQAEDPASAKRDGLDQINPSAQSTAIGDAIRGLLLRKRGQALAGIFVATDGANNVGIPPLEAARLARQENVPLYIYGTGITSPRDIIVGSLLTQEVAFIKDELPLTVRVRGQGLPGTKATLELTLAPADGTEGAVVASKELQFENDDDVVVPLTFTPEKEGDYVLTASIAAREDEASRENNSVTQRLRVVDSRVRLLYVETTPRWEFRYLQNVFTRDRRLQPKFVLFEADAGASEGENSPFLSAVPATREDLFKFDLIILGDVSPKAFTQEQLTALEEFVQKFGGSLLFIAGPRHAPTSFPGTVFEKLLPAELDVAALLAAPPASGSTVELTAQGRSNPMLKLSSNEEESAEIWRGFGKIYWSARVLRAKPAAQVLLVDADPTRGNRHGKLVISALHQYGLGQVMYMGTDNTWRWRRNAGDRFYPILWGQIAQKLGLHHILGGSKRTQLSVDKKSYTTGERVTVYARIYGTDFAPVQEPSIGGSYTVRVANSPGPTQDVTLRAVPDQPGMYRGDFMAMSPGTHAFSTQNDPATSIEFDVKEPKFESGETAMNETLLRQIAEASGGAFFREENLWQLPATISSKAERVTNTVDGEFWSSPLSFLVLLLIGSAEWLLRKRWLLK
jgi:hypothetical protein